LEGSLSVATWDDTAWIGGTTSGTSYRSVALTKILIVNIYIVFKSLHWLKINERVKYKLFSVTYKVLTTNQPQYLYNLIFVQPCHNTRSSSMVTLARPPTSSSLKITNRSFSYATPCLWNESPLISASLVRYSLLPFFLSHMAVHHLHHLHYHRLHLLLLVQYFILNLRLGFLANHFLHRPFSLLLDWFYRLSDHLMFLFCSTAGFVCMVC